MILNFLFYLKFFYNFLDLVQKEKLALYQKFLRTKLLFHLHGHQYQIKHLFGLVSFLRTFKSFFL